MNVDDRKWIKMVIYECGWEKMNIDGNIWMWMTENEYRL